MRNKSSLLGRNLHSSSLHNLHSWSELLAGRLQAPRPGGSGLCTPRSFKISVWVWENQLWTAFTVDDLMNPWTWLYEDLSSIAAQDRGRKGSGNSQYQIGLEQCGTLTFSDFWWSDRQYLALSKQTRLAGPSPPVLFCVSVTITSPVG